MHESEYLQELVDALRRVLGEGLVGVYAGGSWALGGYEPGRSDLDVAAVVRAPLDAATKAAVVAAVRHEALPCPARGLELVVYTLAAARSATVEAAFELNLNSGARMAFRADTEPVTGERHWFAIDRSILVRHGVALVGPAAADVFAELPREALLPLLAETVRWYERHDPGSEDAIRNAARARTFEREGVWTPKPPLRRGAGGRPRRGRPRLPR